MDHSLPMMIPRRGHLTLALLALTSCRTAAPNPDLPVATSLPRLVERGVVTGPESWRGNGGMAVSPTGVLGFTISGKEDDPRMVFVDSAGRILKSFSRSGDGPGEVRAIGGLWFDGDTLAGFDLMTQRTTRFDRDGRMLATIQIAGIGQPAGMGPEGMVTVLIGNDGPEIVAIDAGGAAAPLVDRADLAYDSIVRAPYREIGKEDRIPMPALAERGNRIAFADAWTCRVAWARDGRVFARYGDGTIYAARSDEDDLQYLERYRDCGNGCDSRGVRVGE